MMKILCVSLGCDKNLVDTEKMLGLLRADGYEFTDDEAQADIVLVNTCCFIGDAKEESINTILELGQLKDTGRCRALIVAGCLAQRYQDEIMEEMPEVDACVGTTAYDHVAQVIRDVLDGKKERHFMDVDRLPEVKASRIMTTGGCYAYLKIAEGCDKRCTYCVIPYVRGRYRSVPMADLIKEARDLAGLPMVRLSIALDVGDVMVGVVGDESQMEPTTLSTSFTTVKRLIQLCARLEAGILCTESMIAGARDYGSRYMGRSGQGEQSVRVYEIFEGDPYDVRRLKESTVGEFTQAVYALYSQDYAAAKRTFLELVHNGQADGGARYYLYLSDKLEKGGSGSISLD